MNVGDLASTNAFTNKYPRNAVESITPLQLWVSLLSWKIGRLLGVNNNLKMVCSQSKIAENGHLLGMFSSG